MAGNLRASQVVRKVILPPHPFTRNVFSMPKVTFVNEKRELEVADGANLRDERAEGRDRCLLGAVRLSELPGPTACAAPCRVLVTKGKENLSPKTRIECFRLATRHGEHRSRGRDCASPARRRSTATARSRPSRPSTGAATTSGKNPIRTNDEPRVDASGWPAEGPIQGTRFVVFGALEEKGRRRFAASGPTTRDARL